MHITAARPLHPAQRRCSPRINVCVGPLPDMRRLEIAGRTPITVGVGGRASSDCHRSNPDEPNTAHRPPWNKGKLGLKIVSAISASAPKMGDLWDRISPRSLSACLSFLSEAAQTFATVVSQVGS